MIKSTKLIIACLAILFMTSCATKKKTYKKCDGSKGVKTNMGVM